jgi:hypothetical protein
VPYVVSDVLYVKSRVVNVVVLQRSLNL